MFPSMAYTHKLASLNRSWQSNKGTFCARAVLEGQGRLGGYGGGRHCGEDSSGEGVEALAAAAAAAVGTEEWGPSGPEAAMATALLIEGGCMCRPPRTCARGSAGAVEPEPRARLDDAAAPPPGPGPRIRTPARTLDGRTYGSTPYAAPPTP